ncbi:MAG TPA: hypothetical protein VGX03_27395, partial [Candidatus Binatia bacterium]|nr:hypothetical protein [Candidatus Binatia bacterium]
PSTLRPPNHQLIPISISGVTDPDGDPVIIAATSVFQDEPVTGEGSGSTAPDAILIPLQVRAERNGTGDGRVYHITFTAIDDKGGTCTGAVTVCVPRDQGRGATCVDEGALYNSLVP